MPLVPIARPVDGRQLLNRQPIQSRVGWLSKEMGDDRTAERAFSQARPAARPQPTATYAVIAVTVFVSLLTLLGATELEGWLFLDKSAVYFDDQYWRLLTVALVHDSNLPIHLIFNMYALFIIGPIIEALYGPRRFLLMYVICVAAGSVASFATSRPSVSVPAAASSGSSALCSWPTGCTSRR